MHEFRQNPDVDARVCVCGLGLDHHVHTGDSPHHGCDQCQSWLLVHSDVTAGDEPVNLRDGSVVSLVQFGEAASVRIVIGCRTVVGRGQLRIVLDHDYDIDGAVGDVSLVDRSHWTTYEGKALVTGRRIALAGEDGAPWNRYNPVTLAAGDDIRVRVRRVG